MSPITRFRDTFAKPGVDPRVVERIQGINIETGRLSIGRSGKEFYVPQQPAEFVCYIASEDFNTPLTCRPEDEAGVAVIGDRCILYGDLRVVDGDASVVEFNLPPEAWPLFSVQRSIITNKNAEPPYYTPFMAFVYDVFDSFDSDTLKDSDKWITKYGEDSTLESGHVFGDWIGVMTNTQPALGSRTTVKFRKTGPGAVDIMAAVRAQWKPEVLYDYNLWGIWGRCRSGGIDLMAWGDEDASHDGPMSAIGPHNIVTGVDYWLRTTVDEWLDARVDLFNANPASASEPVASTSFNFADSIEEFPAVANLQAPGRAGAHNLSGTPNVYVDYALYEVPKMVNDYNAGVITITNDGKLSIIPSDGTLDDGTLIQFGQLQYIKK